MNKHKKSKHLFYEFFKKKPGRRFLHLYSKVNHSINENIFIRIILFALGLGFVLIGIVLLFIPGPGILTILVGAALLCVISKKIAFFFDKLEKKIRQTSQQINRR